MKEPKRPTKLTDIQEASDSILEETPAKPRKKGRSVLMNSFNFVKHKTPIKKQRYTQTTLNAFLKRLKKL